MAEDTLTRRHRQASQHLRADQAFQRSQNQRSHSMLRKTVHISRLSSTIDRLAREERSERLRALLDRIATEKAEALRRVDRCSLPWHSPQQSQWRREVERVDITADDATAALTEIIGHVKRHRTEHEPTSHEAESGQPSPLEAAVVIRRPDFLAGLGKPARGDDAQRVQLTASLLLLELQLKRLIDLSRDWQAA